MGNVLGVIVSVIVLICVDAANAAELHDGDIIFQRSQSRQAQAIAAATKSEYTHMGVIFFSAGKPFVYEAIQPVTQTPLDAWIKRGVDEHYVIKRLKDVSKVDFSQVQKEVLLMMGRDYDWLFEWSDEKIYCSELVWKAYQRAAGIELGSRRKLGDFDLNSKIVRKIMQERYGKNVPLGMAVIAPSDIFTSEKLSIIEEK